jgi:hypothetical protein
MRILSFKILVLCILLPPVLYIASALLLERNLNARYTRGIEDSYIGDPRPLLEGSLSLKDVISRNIDSFLNNKILIRIGIKVNVTVKTKSGEILYPTDFEETDNSPLTPKPSQVATENFRLMNEGIVLDVETRFEHNRVLSNGLLTFCIILSIFIFYLHYRILSNKLKFEDHQRSLELEQLRELEKVNRGRLEGLRQERENIQTEFDVLKEILEDEKKKAERNEDELIGEIENLEAKLDENIARQEFQHKEILELKEQIEKYGEGPRRVDKKRSKAADSVSKRFGTLYKNLSVNERAIRGFLDLNDELKIKAEEVIHQLNSDPSQVAIKRKVFRGEGQKTVLEAVFGYKGRLYFRHARDTRIEVLAIGTKNTQSRELKFLAGL